ncbi:MAG TPA: SprB repeat-containing protein, partial [Bacteroidia bacterium]
NSSISVASAQNNVSCNSFCDGTISTNASGGSPGYLYNWSPGGSTTSMITGLCARNYSLTVTDAIGCAQTTTFVITNPPATTLSLSQTPPLCHGGSDGSLYVTPTGGTPPFSYSWNNGQTTQNATGLLAGNYSVTATDDNGCVSTQTISLSQPTLLTSTPSHVNNVCNGGSKGSASVVVSGGSPPYSYTWSNGATTAQISNLTSQTYSVTVTDDNNCTVTNTFSITQPGAFTSTTTHTNISCHGGNNGTASVNLGGGNAPFSYAWSNGQTTSTSTGLIAGNYSVNVTDVNGCTANATVTITEPAAISLTTSVTPQTCNQGNGMAHAQITGGTASYTYNWSVTPLQTTQTVTGLSTGNYSLTITDANGCTAANTFSIASHSAFTSTVTPTNALCHFGNSGSALANAIGGSSPFTYLWSNGQIFQTATGLVAGNYSFTITDANGCTSSNSVTISQPPAMTSSISVTPEN